MLRVLSVLALGLALITFGGCKKSKHNEPWQPVVLMPKYLTQTGVIPHVSGADMLPGIGVHFDTSKVLTFNSGGWTLNRQIEDVTPNYPGKPMVQQIKRIELGGNLGQTFTDALVFQLRKAGFQSTPATIDETTKANPGRAILTGSVANLDIQVRETKIPYYPHTRSIDGRVQITVCLKGQDNAVIYQDSREYVASEIMIDKASGKNLDSMLLTNIINQLCEKPEFVAALQKLASGG